MQTVTSPEGLRRASGRAALARGAVLASLLVSGVAPPVPAQQMPPGCGAPSMTFKFFVERADGSEAGAGSAGQQPRRDRPASRRY